MLKSTFTPPFRYLLALSLALAALATGGAETAAPPPPYLPGIIQFDPAPLGCVSCHVDLGGGKDLRLNKAVELLPGHPDITKAFKGSLIPDTCILCHREGSKLGSLGPNLHKVHYGRLESSSFIRDYGGSCLLCHDLDPATGELRFKSGKANW